MYPGVSGAEVVGCVRVDGRTAEFEKVFVRPARRGHGAGLALLSRIMAEMRACGYASARLETAVFMRAALAMYHRQGFVRVAPFRRPIGDTGDMSVFMLCDLAAHPQG